MGKGELDPLRYDVHIDAPQELARMLAGLVPVGSRVLRNAKIIWIEPNSHRPRLLARFLF
jgi:hypothetical protein